MHILNDRSFQLDLYFAVYKVFTLIFFFPLKATNFVLNSKIIKFQFLALLSNINKALSLDVYTFLALLLENLFSISPFELITKMRMMAGILTETCP